jgi:dolichol-phosphate mannosyltransferase
MHPSETAAAMQLAVVVPTYNERANVHPFLEALEKALVEIPHEVIFVDDDSPDGTAAEIRSIALRNPQIRVLQRIGRRGLSSACLEGMMATAAPWVAVMDADLQHDERSLPEMFRLIVDGKLDLVVASRNIGSGSMGEFARSRVRLSNLGRRLSKLISKADLSDPMSGFFVADREFVEMCARSVSGVGFKILLDLTASSPRAVRFAEVPYTFRNRLHGTSKLDILVGLEYLQLLLDKTVGNLIPARFVTYSLVGATGYLIFLGLLYLLLSLGGLNFATAQVIATVIVIAANFFLNNSLTYRDLRLKGRGLLTGLLMFYAGCSIGVFLNVRLAEYARSIGVPWYGAGAAGLAVGAVWNYGVSAAITWRRVLRRAARATAVPGTEAL